MDNGAEVLKAKKAERIRAGLVIITCFILVTVVPTTVCPVMSLNLNL